MKTQCEKSSNYKSNKNRLYHYNIKNVIHETAHRFSIQPVIGDLLIPSYLTQWSSNIVNEALD